MTVGGVNLDKFSEDVETIKDELQSLETVHNQLQMLHEQSKTLNNAKSVKHLRSKMDNVIAVSLKKAKFIKVRLESLDRSNDTNRSLPGCGPGSSSDRTRTSVVNGLLKKLSDSMSLFNDLRNKMSSEYSETVQRGYYTSTRENPVESMVDKLIAIGQIEILLQKAIQEQGRGQVMNTILEIQDSVKEIEQNLDELHLGEQLDAIENQISFLDRGRASLVAARKHQKNIRKWMCFGIVLVLIVIVILIIILSIKPWKNSGGGGGGGGNNNPTPGGTPPPPSTTTMPTTG